MKANRKAVRHLSGEEEAVSPVIGVILMVAITVVLAAVVFVLVSDLGSDSNAPSAVKFQKDEANDRIKVVSAESTADWDKIEVKADATGAELELNAAADGVGGTAITTALVAVSSATDPMSAGEYIELCGTAGAVSDLTVTLIDSSANQILAELTFSSVAAC